MKVTSNQSDKKRNIATTAKNNRTKRRVHATITIFSKCSNLISYLVQSINYPSEKNLSSSICPLPIFQGSLEIDLTEISSETVNNDRLTRIAILLGASTLINGFINHFMIKTVTVPYVIDYCMRACMKDFFTGDLIFIRINAGIFQS